MSDRKDELKRQIESLSEMEIEELDREEELADRITEEDLDAINDLPLLYRMELKRLLDRHNNPLADQIRA